MTTIIDGPVQDVPDPAAKAFEALREEVALARRAVAGLAAERASIEIPDYSATLGEIAKGMADMAETTARLASRPALNLTPGGIAQQIAAGAIESRRDDHAMLQSACKHLDQVSLDLKTRLSLARQADAQNRWLAISASTGLLAGMLLWALGFGPVVRVMPASWRLPEHMAARMLRLDMWSAGEQLLRSSQPDNFHRLVQASYLADDNRDRISACQASAARMQKPAPCVVQVQPAAPASER